MARPNMLHKYCKPTNNLLVDTSGDFVELTRDAFEVLACQHLVTRLRFVHQDNTQLFVNDSLVYEGSSMSDLENALGNAICLGLKLKLSSAAIETIAGRNDWFERINLVHL
jgi:hypothetical protein